MGSPLHGKVGLALGSGAARGWAHVGVIRGLRATGIEPYVRQDRPEIYFTDPDGITVQLSDKDYRG